MIIPLPSTRQTQNAERTLTKLTPVPRTPAEHMAIVRQSQRVLGACAWMMMKLLFFGLHLKCPSIIDIQTDRQTDRQTETHHRPLAPPGTRRGHPRSLDACAACCGPAARGRSTQSWQRRPNQPESAQLAYVQTQPPPSRTQTRRQTRPRRLCAVAHMRNRPDVFVPEQVLPPRCVDGLVFAAEAQLALVVAAPALPCHLSSGQQKQNTNRGDTKKQQQTHSRRRRAAAAAAAAGAAAVICVAPVMYPFRVVEEKKEEGKKKVENLLTSKEVARTLFIYFFFIFVSNVRWRLRYNTNRKDTKNRKRKQKKKKRNQSVYRDPIVAAKKKKKKRKRERVFFFRRLPI